MKKFLIPPVLSALAIPQISQAAEFVPYLGIFGGYNFTRHAPGVGDHDKDGFGTGVQAFGSIEAQNTIFNLGAGYQYEKIFGHQDTETSEGFAETSFLFRANKMWALGPMAQYHFGTDNRRDDAEFKERGMITGGLKISYQAMMNKWNPYRIDLSLQRSITQLRGDQDYYTALVGFSIGFPWVKPPPPVEIVVIPVEVEKIVEVEKPVLVPVEVAAPEPVIIKMQDSQVGFKTGKWELNSATKMKLKELGVFLAAHADEFEQVKVGGHTDSRGSLKLNQKLSENRATVVKNALVKGGVPKDKISSEGYNFSQPAVEGNDEEAWSQNRRTEIQFFGVKDPQGFNDKLNEIMGK